jgi:hypothetical protein
LLFAGAGGFFSVVGFVAFIWAFSVVELVCTPGSSRGPSRLLSDILSLGGIEVRGCLLETSEDDVGYTGSGAANVESEEKGSCQTK